MSKKLPAAGNIHEEGIKSVEGHLLVNIRSYFDQSFRKCRLCVQYVQHDDQKKEVEKKEKEIRNSGSPVSACGIGVICLAAEDLL